MHFVCLQPRNSRSPDRPQALCPSLPPSMERLCPSVSLSLDSLEPPPLCISHAPYSSRRVTCDWHGPVLAHPQHLACSEVRAALIGSLPPRAGSSARRPA
eukprot:6174548-Pleurochrysis_carterae.AAC.1